MSKLDNSCTILDIESIKQALYSVNRHAKTAISKRELYRLKYETLLKLIKIGHAQKVHLEYSTQTGRSQQSTVVLVKVGTKTEGEPLYFHMLPEKDDFKCLNHTGAAISQNLHNPKSTMSLNTAKRILQQFVGVTKTKDHATKSHQFQRSHSSNTTYKSTRSHTSQKSKRSNKPSRPALNKNIFTSSFLDGSSRPRK